MQEYDTSPAGQNSRRLWTAGCLHTAVYKHLATKHPKSQVLSVGSRNPGVNDHGWLPVCPFEPWSLSYSTSRSFPRSFDNDSGSHILARLSMEGNQTAQLPFVLCNQPRDHDSCEGMVRMINQDLGPRGSWACVGGRSVTASVIARRRISGCG